MPFVTGGVVEAWFLIVIAMRAPFTLTLLQLGTSNGDGWARFVFGIISVVDANLIQVAVWRRTDATDPLKARRTVNLDADCFTMLPEDLRLKSHG